jgi:hypothetical protein
VDPDAAIAQVDAVAQQGLEAVREPLRSQLADDRLRALADQDIRSDPSRFLRKVMLRSLAFLSPLKTPLGSAEIRVEDGRILLHDYQGNFVDGARHWTSLARQTSLFVISLFAIPLGLLGMMRYSFESSSSRYLALASLLFVTANIGLYALSGAETRYRLPLDPLFIVWAWMSVALLFRRLANG